jgi:ribonuclease P protein component
MVLFYRANDLDYSRVLFTTKKGYGTAVARNRARRHGREAFRRLKNRVNTGFDLAFVFYPGSYVMVDRTGQMETLLGQAGLLRETGPRDVAL